MARNQADITATGLAAILACVAAAAGAPAIVMTVLGIMLFAAPGYLLVQILFGPGTAGLERLVVMVALAVAVPILGGLLLYAIRVPLHRPAWLGLLAGVTLAGDAVLFLRRRFGRANSFHWQLSWHLPRRQAGILAAAIVVAACAVGLARAGVAIQHQSRFTQLWLSPKAGNKHIDYLGVSNNEGGTASYRLVLLRNGHASATWNLTLTVGETWERTVSLAGKSSLAASLYKLPDTSHWYRHVNMGSREPAGSSP